MKEREGERGERERKRENPQPGILNLALNYASLINPIEALIKRKV